jgi:hypothetical protein
MASKEQHQEGAARSETVCMLCDLESVLIVTHTHTMQCNDRQEKYQAFAAAGGLNVLNGLKPLIQLLSPVEVG